VSREKLNLRPFEGLVLKLKKRGETFMKFESGEELWIPFGEIDIFRL